MTALPWLCRHCHFEVEIDDLWLPLSNGYCICVRCATAALELPSHMDKRLRAALSQTLNEVPE